jgi:hypothetical protein
MKALVKYKPLHKWEDFPTDQLIGSSVVEQMLATEKPMVAALVDESNEKDYLFVVSNNESLRKQYEDRNIPFMSAEQMDILLGKNPVIDMVLRTFEGSSLLSISDSPAKQQMDLIEQ